MYLFRVNAFFDYILFDMKVVRPQLYLLKTNLSKNLENTIIFEIQKKIEIWWEWGNEYVICEDK